MSLFSKIPDWRRYNTELLKEILSHGGYSDDGKYFSLNETDRTYIKNILSNRVRTGQTSGDLDAWPKDRRKRLMQFEKRFNERERQKKDNESFLKNLEKNKQ